MSILSRFTEIIKANVNDAIDKMEDPGKMIDQYLREMRENLAEVKQETAAIMAEETRAKRLLDENAAEVAKYQGLALKALQAGNEEDAKVFIAKKQEVEAAGAGLNTAYVAAAENSKKMRQMHDKLVSDIQTLESRKEMIKAKVSVAKTQEKINQMSNATAKADGAMAAFDRMEEKANRMMDQASAMAQLNASTAVDEAKALESKYGKSSDISVDNELEEMKRQLGLSSNG